MNEYTEYADVLEGSCPFGGNTIGGAQTSKPTLSDWYPDRLRVEQLHRDGAAANPLSDFDYEAAFNAIDLDELKADIKHFLTTSVDWWPSDYGNYGPQMIRMAWHAAGTYRIADGRGGAGQALQRFAPISSWWDNGNTDKSRRLLWPIKKKYGNALSWADLMILTGNCALEIMGFPTTGFGGGRRDAWEADDATYWGPEYIENSNPESYDAMVMRSERWTGEPGDSDYELEQPLAASHQALIYVNPEGPNENGNPQDSAIDVRITFGRMAMNDEETVALIAGGHAFGKSHGKVAAGKIGPPPEISPIEDMGLGWANPEGKGFAEYTMTNGIEGSWTPDPTQWDNSYLENLFKYEWEKIENPDTGATQWKPVDSSAPKTPDAHLEGVEHDLMMMTSDIALKVDPVYREICERFLADFDYFTQEFSKAWYKLTHRDMGPKSRYLGPEVAAEDFIWQDPLPVSEHPVVGADDVATLKQAILDTGVSVSDLAYTAFSAAVTYRDTDKRGGANGARLALAPQKDWAVNRRTVPVVAALSGVMEEFNASSSAAKVSLADLIVLGGCVAVAQAAQAAGEEVEVPFTPGRVDATDEQTDIAQFQWLAPVVDGFRNFVMDDYATVAPKVSPEQMFLDRASLLSLSAPEWVVLTGGLRVLGCNHDGSSDGVFTDRVGVLSTDFFENLTSMDYEWTKVDEAGLSFTLDSRETGETVFRATRNDLVFGSNTQLRNIAEVYAGSDGQARFVRDFVKVWDKVMMSDRYDVKKG